MRPDEIIPAIIRAQLHHFRGRLGKDPQMKYFPSGTMVANASIAVDRPDKRRDDQIPPDWFDLQIWGEQGEQFANRFRQGHTVLVVGRVEHDKWTNPTTGEINYKVVIKVEGFKDGSLTPLDQGEVVPPPAAPVAAPAQHPAYAAAGYQPQSVPAAPAGPVPAVAPPAAPPAAPAAPGWATNDPPF